MGSILTLCSTVIAIYIPLTKCDKEWIFQFDLKNENNWDNYQITHNDDNTLPTGQANGCSPRIPKVFKKLCVNYDDQNGYKLQFKSAINLNIDPNYHDLLWYYGDHQTAKNAETVAKAKYIDLEDQELTEITPSTSLLRRRLITKDSVANAKKCYYYNDLKACAHLDVSSNNFLTVSVGLKAGNGYDNDDNDDDDDINAAEYEEYGDYEDYDYDYDEYDDSDLDEDSNVNNDEYGEYYNDYGDYDMSEIYDELLQEQALFNQQWANYLTELNNLYWQNFYQNYYPQQQLSAANALYNNYYGFGDSGEKTNQEGDEDEEGAELSAGFGLDEGSIMQKAEQEARQHVEQRMEKKLEARLEKEMMSKMGSGDGIMGMLHGGGGGGGVHSKHGYDEGEDDEGGEGMSEGDDEHGAMPIDEGDGEDDQNAGPPHDSLSMDS